MSQEISNCKTLSLRKVLPYSNSQSKAEGRSPPRLNASLSSTPVNAPPRAVPSRGFWSCLANFPRPPRGEEDDDVELTRLKNNGTSSDEALELLRSILMSSESRNKIESGKTDGIPPEALVDVSVLQEYSARLGVPDSLRGIVWRILIGYAPSTSRGVAALVSALTQRNQDETQREALSSLWAKRREYVAMVEQVYQHLPFSLVTAWSGGSDDRREAAGVPKEASGGRYLYDDASLEMKLMTQLHKDIPRTLFSNEASSRSESTVHSQSGAMQLKKEEETEGSSFTQHPRVQATMERVLFSYGMRHPAVGYIQGMNFLLLPFLSVVLAEKACKSGPSLYSVEALLALRGNELKEALSYTSIPEKEWREELEPDVYWLCSALLDVVQGHFAQEHKGFLELVKEMEAVVQQADPCLYEHFKGLGVQMIQFAFRWLNCFLILDLKPWQVLRLFDVYMTGCMRGKALAIGTRLHGVPPARPANESSLAGKAPIGEGNGSRSDFSLPSPTIDFSAESKLEYQDCLVFHMFICVALLLHFAPQLIRIAEFPTMISFLQHLPADTISHQDMEELIAEAHVLQCLFQRKSNEM